MGEERLGRIRSAVIGGVDATLVTAEVHRGAGLPRQTIVGLPGSAVRESLDRIHAACAHSGLTLPPRRTTVNLAPAGHRKSGAGLDLPIALALLAADGVVDGSELADVVCLGELSLDGRVRPISGVLPVALAARQAGRRTLLVPADNAAEAAAVPDLRVLPVSSLRQAAAWADGAEELVAAEPAASADNRDRPDEDGVVDLVDIQGHRAAKRALEVAAAGGHHLLMTGPPGAGKTLLARALAGLLPPLSFDEALEASAVHSVTGGLVGRGLLHHRPFRAPHHSVTAAGLAGGGSPLRPGEISLATHGLLFLDELPEFRRGALEVLRQPLEEGRILLSRANESHEFPARFQMVAAMNECPCGRGPGDPECRCGHGEIARYWRRVSGPLLDRMDLFIAVERVPLEKIIDGGEDGDSSAAVRERVVGARRLQRQRMEELRRTDPRPPAGETNAALPARGLEAVCALPPALREQARDMAERLRLSARAWHRVLRVARTVADLDGAEEIERPHLTEALQYREPVAPGSGDRPVPTAGPTEGDSI